MAPQTLRFLSWARESLGSLATTVESGRARGQTTVELTGRNPAGAVTTSGTRTVPFLLAGPADIGGLKPGAIVGRYPMPGTIDAESDKSSHVELADPTLPWRYSPAGNPAAGSGALHTWLALVVGIAEEELTLVGSQVTLSQAVQAASSARRRDAVPVGARPGRRSRPARCAGGERPAARSRAGLPRGPRARLQCSRRTVLDRDRFRDSAGVRRVVVPDRDPRRQLPGPRGGAEPGRGRPRIPGGRRSTTRGCPPQPTSRSAVRWPPSDPRCRRWTARSLTTSRR